MKDQAIPPKNITLGLEGFAKRLNQLIAETELSQAEFARQVGVSGGFLSDVVRGLKKPGAEFFYGIRTVFGASCGLAAYRGRHYV